MRPRGVVLVAVYHFLGGAILMVAAIWLVIQGSDLIVKFSRGMYSSEGVTGVATVMFILGAVVLLAGHSIWNLREWGRILCIVLAALSVLYYLASLTFPNIFNIVRLVCNILFVWYLTRPRIKALFRRRTPALPSA